MNFNYVFISHFGSHIQRKLQTKIFPKPYETIRIKTFEFKISAYILTNELSATVYKNEYEKLLKTEPV